MTNLCNLLNNLNDFMTLARPAGESCNPLISEVPLPKSKPPVVPKNAELNPNFNASNWTEFNSFISGRP